MFAFYASAGNTCPVLADNFREKGLVNTTLVKHGTVALIECYEGYSMADLTQRKVIVCEDGAWNDTISPCTGMNGIAKSCCMHPASLTAE